jgi:hypothetical protein
MIASYTTVANARAIIGDLFSSAEFIPLVNQATERVINSGLWKGSIGYAAFPTVSEFFALPYPFLSVIGAQWFRCPVPVFGQFHDFIMGGPGQPIANQCPEGIVEDLGDGYATTADPPTAGSTLKIQLDLLIDSGKTFRLYGISNGRQIFDVFGMGMNLTVTYPASSVATVFDQVTALQPPTNADGSSAMIGGWSVISVAPDGTETTIAYIYPNQANPQFRRYRIGDTTSTGTTVPNAVTVLVRRRFMPVYKETDYIIPGNIGALKFAMQGIQTESSTNDAEPLWDKCFSVLNQELHAVRGAVRPEMSYETLGSLGGFSNVY